MSDLRHEWIIIVEPKCIPEVKHPGFEADGTALGFARAALMCRPEGTRVLIATLTDCGWLQVDDANEALNIHYHMASMTSADLTAVSTSLEVE